MVPTPPQRFAPARARVWPWLVAALAIAALLLAILVDPSTDTDPIWGGLLALITIEFLFGGAVLVSRVPGNRVAAIMLWAGAILAGTVALGTISVLAAAHGDLPGVAGIAGVLFDVGFGVALVMVLIGIPLTFPDGHLLSPRWRWIVVLVVVVNIGQAFGGFVRGEPLGPAQAINPYRVPALEPVAAALDAFASWTSFIAFGAAALAVVLRYRRGNEIERQQVKWLIAVSAVVAIAFPIALVLPPSSYSDFFLLVGLLALLALPVAIGVAILRYRLYDIDRIISRTIGWTLVSGLLVTAFAIVVVGLQATLAGVTQGDTLAVAASTLVAFALFQPVRRTVQRTVDRRFDRARYDAQRTVDAFAERLRDEVDLDTLAAELERTVAGTVRPTAASLWLPGRPT
jgi:hypothetical protein